jgi:hypothetical protein
MLLTAGCSKHAEQKVADAKGKVSEAKENVADATQDLKQATDEARADWKQNWLSYKSDVDKGVADNETSIAALRTEVAKLDTSYQAKYTARLDDAERKNHELKNRVTDYQDEGDAKWELFKTDTTRELGELKTTIKSIFVTNG